MATMCNYDPVHRRIELGHIWYVPAAQRTGVNTETIYLLLKHCFEEYQTRRVEWKCDSLNESSRAAALRLGFQFEGIFRQHMIVKGRNRDTAWFGMTDGDWPEVEARLRARLT
jgi:RimJ/RimL family protein N-acetyltransferase